MSDLQLSRSRTFPRDSESAEWISHPQHIHRGEGLRSKTQRTIDGNNADYFFELLCPTDEWSETRDTQEWFVKLRQVSPESSALEKIGGKAPNRLVPIRKKSELTIER